VSPENLVLEEGKSSELAQCLHVVQEATVDDDSKYSEKTCRELARHIVCRTYAPVVHELCHLVVIASHGGSASGRYEELFWDAGVARAGAFRAYLSARPWQGTAVSVAGGEAGVEYSDKPFAVSYGRMPLLSALMEFAMTALGYTSLDEALAPLVGELPNAAAVSEAANDLSRRLYAYLNDHLPPVQAQRKNRSFLAFAADNAGGNLTAQSLSDDLVMDYWLANAVAAADAAPGDIDARTFRGVFETAARLIRILRHAEDKYRLGGALPIGTDRDAGEVDPADFERAIGEIEDDDDPLALAEETLGGAVKFLNKRELAQLGETVHGAPVSQALPRSILRSAVFGQAQARLTQAQRGKPKPGELAALVGELPDQDYEASLEDYWRLVEHMDRMALAGLHVLARAGNPAAISLALALRPEMDLQGLTPPADEEPAAGNVVSFQAASAGKRFFAALENNGEGAGEGDLPALGAEARSAFKAVSRKGFTDKDLADGAIVDMFADGTKLLLAVRRELLDFLENPAASIDWTGQFDADKPVFNKQFMLLYGGQDG